jgi:hypothetical protein
MRTDLSMEEESEKARKGRTPGELCVCVDTPEGEGLDARIKTDLGAGDLDNAMLRALEDEEEGRLRRL